MVRIYTRTGDDGTTGLIGGKRVSKHSPRVDAYGCVDELNSVLSLVRSLDLPERIETILGQVQDELFTIGAHLARPQGADPGEAGFPPISGSGVLLLEKEIDECETEIKPLREFILPGGSKAGALLHLARTVSRRAERSCVALSRIENVDPRILQYLNRLSDLCFVLARFVNHLASKPEIHPRFGRS